MLRSEILIDSFPREILLCENGNWYESIDFQKKEMMSEFRIVFSEMFMLCTYNIMNILQIQ